MNTEQDLAKCPFCGKAAYVSEPDAPSLGYEIGCPDNWGFKRGAHGHCNVAPAATGMTYAETAERWNRRSSDEQAEVVGYVTEDALKLMREAKPGSGWRYHMFAKDQTDRKASIPLYASPPAVAAGGVTEEMLKSALAASASQYEVACNLQASSPESYAECFGEATPPELAMRAALTASLVHQAIDGYVQAIVDRQHGGVAQDRAFNAICEALGRSPTAEMDARRRPTPPSRGEGV